MFGEVKTSDFSWNLCRNFGKLRRPYNPLAVSKLHVWTGSVPLSNSSMGLFEDAVSFFDWFLRGCAATPPKKRSYSEIRLPQNDTCLFTFCDACCFKKRSVSLEKESISASSKNWRKKCNNLCRVRRKITGAISLRNFTKPRKPSRKNCQLGRALEEYVYFKLKYEIASNYILSFC